MTGELLVVILGPTAVGKTGYAIHLAQALNGEIISADSRQTYRYLDIGTAKPTPQQRQQVIHHLLDVVDPDDNLSVAQYQELAYGTIADIHQRGKLPLLVGGTGQYITAVVEGWTIPRVEPNYDLRAELETVAAEQGVEVLHHRLRIVDPAAASNIHVRNVRRVIRALEVYLQTGQPMSVLQRKQPPPYTIVQAGLTMERTHLYAQADRRLHLMMEQGFLAEVRDLLARGYTRNLPSMSGLGYAQLATHLLGECTLDEAVQATCHATHKFIRQQYTWFRGHDRGIVWMDVEQTSAADLVEMVKHVMRERS